MDRTKTIKIVLFVILFALIIVIGGTQSKAIVKEGFYKIEFDENQKNIFQQQNIRFSIYAKAGEITTIPTTIPKRNNCSFICWQEAGNSIRIMKADVNELKNEKKGVYMPGEKLTMPARNVLLKAIWFGKIKLDCNYTEGNKTIIMYNIEEPIILTEEQLPTRDGYNFLGWSKDSNATKEECMYGKDINKKVIEGTTLYAIWDKTEDKEEKSEEKVSLISKIVTQVKNFIMKITTNIKGLFRR